ncbi:MAG: hypothetical protein MUC62_06210 [Candidatus Thermoplasmatota archaeon]|jgi:hypothetical protein|nr:hypothetical protein [Candidatus Thermoplasmatota archaeon]
MVIRSCPNCLKESPIWDIKKQICNYCQYSLDLVYKNPSSYQRDKIMKHTFGSTSINDSNWIFYEGFRQDQGIIDVCSIGSYYNGRDQVFPFPYYIGCKENDSEKKTNWGKVVISHSPEYMHLIPADPEEFSDIEWTCHNCGKKYIGLFYPSCPECNQPMWNQF